MKLNSAGASTLSAEEQRNLYSYIGSSDPLFSGGFVNTFNIKRFEVVVNFIFNLKLYSRVGNEYKSGYIEQMDTYKYQYGFSGIIV